MGERAYYVYLYRDPDTNEICYVGKGTRSRVDEVIHRVYEKPDHGVEDLEVRDKRRVRSWMRRLEKRGLAPLVEVMPCESQSQALAVEAGLISALWDRSGLLNAVHGHGRRFTPLGLPPSLAGRRYEKPLTRDDIAGLGGAVAVYISARSFFESDARRGSAPRLALSRHAEEQQRDDAHRRIRRWWQVGAHVHVWAESPDHAPVLLLGVTGPITSRWIWGSLSLDRNGWSGLERQHGGLYELPTTHGKKVEDSDFDAASIRGRRLADDAVGPVMKDGRRQFGGIRSQFFDVIPPASSCV